MEEDISSKTGEDIYQKRAMPLNEVTFNGEYGFFLERDRNAKKDKETGEYPRTQLTEGEEALEVVYLKIRRSLFYYDEILEKFWNTNEHNHKNERVVLYQADGTREIGIAKELREKYDFLSTQQIVYCYLPKYDRVARLLIKGASLGSRFEHKEEVLKFYDYLQTFGKDEHSWQFKTKLKPVAEINKMKKKYFAISFIKGDRIDEEDEAKIRKMIDEVHENVKAIDARVQEGIGAPKVEEKGKKPLMERDESIPVIEEGAVPKDFKFPESNTDEVDVKDIPF
jgi:hypothetical protein